MTAVAWLARRHARRRWASLVGLAVLVALGATATFVAAGAADRTRGAYAEYLERASVSDLVINPALQTTEIDPVIRGLPGVRSVTTDVLFIGTLDDGRPRTRATFSTYIETLQVRGSADGRYSTMDRPAVAEGRLPDGPGEALLGVQTAATRGITVGDVVPVAFWSPSDQLAAAPDDVVHPIGVERLRIVGIATFPDEVLPDELHPRERMMVSPQVAERYDCLSRVPSADMAFDEALGQMWPSGCGTSYRYWSLDLEDGSAGVPEAIDAFVERSAPLNEALPPVVVDSGGVYYLISTATADEQARVERSIRPAVTALGVLAIAVGAVTLVLLALAVARELRQTADDRATWWRLGLGRRDHVVVVGAPLLAAVVAGLAVALVAAWWLSPVAPVGSVRSVEPSPARELSSWVVAAAAGGALVAATLVLLLCDRAVGRAAGPAIADHGTAAGPRAVRRFVPAGAPPDIAEGIRAALDAGRGALLVTAATAVGTGALAAGVVFGASLSRLLTTPAAYGWPWDVAVMAGSGYGGLDLAAVEATLAGRDDVVRWTVLGLDSETTVDGTPVPAVVTAGAPDDTQLAVVEGRLPAAGDELALGSHTASDLGVGVGDEVEVCCRQGTRPATVTGIAIVPPLGAFESDRAGPGDGVILPADWLGPDWEEAGLFTFVGMQLDPGVAATTVGEAIGDDVQGWHALGEAPVTYVRAVRPPEVVNVRSAQVVPVLVGGLLAAGATVGLCVAVLSSVRARRRDLAVLRALGFTGQQVRRTVWAQVMTTMLVALVVGVPVGVAAGRIAWRVFARQLGVATSPATPGWALAATVVGAVVLALLAAAPAGRAAARIRPSAELRTE